MESRSGTELPRSVVLALWLGVSGGPAASPEVVRHAVQRGAEAHRVRLGDGEEVTAFSAFLAECLPARRAAAAVLPAAGDPLGVPAPVAGAAGVAGEVVLVSTPQEHWALVPEVSGYGSDREPGVLVTWEAVRVPPWLPAVVGAVGSVADAERDLTLALRTAVDALDALDVARWREDVAEEIAALAHGGSPADELPVGLAPRAVRMLAQAARLRSIVELATADDGGAVNLWQADQRSTALREVDRAARRALSAASVSG